MERGRLRRPAAAAFALYSLALGFILLNPRMSVPSTGIGWAADAARAIHVPGWFLQAQRFEFLSNALIFVPLPLLGAAAWPAVRPWHWAAIGFGASVFVEVVQGVALVQRSATVIDVVANSLGALLGATVLAAGRRRHSPV
jgi:hypothetical protein